MTMTMRTITCVYIERCATRLNALLSFAIYFRFEVYLLRVFFSTNNVPFILAIILHRARVPSASMAHFELD